MKLKQLVTVIFGIALLFGLNPEPIQGQITPRASVSRSPSASDDQGLHNVILFIGDGMGYEQVKAAGMYLHGSPDTLSFESFPYQAELTTYSASSSVTDSAAAATAIATGQKVNNGVISMAIPGDSGELETVLEYYRDLGKRTGLVSTAYTTHATPAAFGAHETSRSNYAQIAQDYWTQTQPNLIFGGGANGMVAADAIAAGYEVVTNSLDMQALDTELQNMVSGQFGNSHLPYEFDGLDDLPHLSEMTTTALDILDNDPDGFFLMVEGGRIDHAGHANDIQRNIMETIEFANAVQTAVDWAQSRTDTLILVTADHETGGLQVQINHGQGNWPTVFWSTTGHTGVKVPVYAWGVNAQRVHGIMDNTDLHDILTRVEVAGLVATNDGPTLLGTTATLSATISAGGNVSYTWDTGAQVWGSGQTITHTYPATGTFTAVVTASNSLNQVTASTPVTVFAPAATAHSSAALYPEADISIPITVSLDVAPVLTATLNYRTVDGTATAGADYVPISGTLSFSPGMSSQNLWISIISDNNVEFNETIFLTLTNPINLELGAIPLTLTIVDDDNYKMFLPLINHVDNIYSTAGSNADFIVPDD